MAYDYYIPMKKLKSNASFEKMIADYRENPTVDTMRAVFDAFWTLANNIFTAVKFPGMEIAFKTKNSTIRDMVCLAFIKLPRYDATKGRAFNFFTTIMLGWLRQVYRTKRNYVELKAKYAKALESSENRK